MSIRAFFLIPFLLLSFLSLAQPGYRGKTTMVAIDGSNYGNIGLFNDKYSAQRVGVNIRKIITRTEVINLGYRNFRSKLSYDFDVADQTIALSDAKIVGHTLFLGGTTYFKGVNLAPLGTFFTAEIGMLFSSGVVRDNSKIYSLSSVTSPYFSLALGKTIVLSDNIAFEMAISNNRLIGYRVKTYDDSFKSKFERNLKKAYRFDFRIALIYLLK